MAVFSIILGAVILSLPLTYILTQICIDKKIYEKINEVQCCMKTWINVDDKRVDIKRKRRYNHEGWHATSHTLPSYNCDEYLDIKWFGNEIHVKKRNIYSGKRKY